MIAVYICLFKQIAKPPTTCRWLVMWHFIQSVEPTGSQHCESESLTHRNMLWSFKIVNKLFQHVIKTLFEELHLFKRINNHYIWIIKQHSRVVHTWKREGAIKQQFSFNLRISVGKVFTCKYPSVVIDLGMGHKVKGLKCLFLNSTVRVNK